MSSENKNSLEETKTLQDLTEQTTPPNLVSSYMPHYHIDIPFSIPSSKIFDLFSKSAANKHFQILEHSNNSALAVQKERFSFKEIFLCCVPPHSRGLMSSARLSVSINESKCLRSVLLKGIYGFPQNILPLVADFRHRVEKLVTQDSYKNQYELVWDSDPEEKLPTCKHESASYYQFHKILSSEEYALGKSISEFVSSFAQQYRNPEESALLMPQPLESINSTVETTVESLFSEYNYGRPHNEKMMMFCRPAVEKFVYNKVYSYLFPIFQNMSSQEDKHFQTKKAESVALSKEELMQKLGIQEKFCLVELETPYSEAINTFSQLAQEKSPHEKLNSLLSLVSSMKTSVVDYWKGKEELMAMDDELPILMYVLLRSEVQCPSAEMNLLKYYVGRAYENEQRIIVNVQGAVTYIGTELVW